MPEICRIMRKELGKQVCKKLQPTSKKRMQEKLQ